MQRKLILATIVTAIGVTGAGLAANAGTSNETNDAMTEAQMFQAAKVSLDQASQIALKEVPGTLAAIGFNDENGKGVYEAMVIGADGQPTLVKIDADAGTVLGKMLASAEDEDDGENDEGEGSESDEG
ncbi:PepSY domain-containing protein [Mesobacterium sp. TK19101]|uniref:PepSY domain-containing protein n=1 Tax=Mesobacterium hydrothermale TaxID=3111907 RepID=A0ABU6HNT9_9RHOB|nr:PepSY domain-containing protein [Mesobacterium sp. TK19101]MEC3863108.1 PepSY domain-containing protein [Mesobacterium sp. TK19101]